MSNTSFTPKDIIASKKKHGAESRLFKVDVTNTKKNKNPKQPTFYIPASFKNVAGKYQPLNLKYVRQLISSNAKLPHGVEANDAKFLNVSFKKLELKDLESTEYPEDKKEGLLTSNTEFIEALNIIADEYLTCVKEDILGAKSDKFRVIDRKINCFRQDRRVASADDEGVDEDGKVPMDPIYRIHLKADPETKKLGFNSDRGFQYVVFDMRKSEKEAKDTGKPKRDIVARVMVKGKPTDLNINNAKHFVSFMSLTSGNIFFECVCLSKSGVSLMCRFRNLHVWRHKTMKQEAIGDDDRDDMAAYGYRAADGEDEDLDVNVDEPEEENADGAGDDDEEPRSKGKPAAKAKPTSKAVGKPAGKAAGKPANKSSSKAISKALDTDGDDEQPLEENDVDEPTDEPEENDVDDHEESGETKTPPKVANKTAAKSDKADDEPNDEATDEESETQQVKAKTKPKPPAKGGNLKAAPKKK